MSVISALLIRFITGLHPYSGWNSPPMYGDYEAQRHFMEIAFNLPVGQWYTYDPEYWGLDYPILTALHSYAMGYVSHLINPQWTSLYESRGYESSQHKLFMRWTVVLSDLLFYFVPTLLLIKSVDSKVRSNLLLVLLLQPSLIVIDHGHFQYNCVMLGLTLLAICLILKERVITGSICYCLAIGYKHMALYYSLAFFSYLLGKCLSRGFNRGTLLLALLGVSVIGTFGAMMLPLCLYGNDKGCIQSVLQMFSRLFPLHRGLFEDKVANFWCAMNVVIKFREIFRVDQLFKLAALMTLIGCIPSCLYACRLPTPRNFIYCLCCVSLSFFMFSFQVHEKSILLPLLPIMCLLVVERDAPSTIGFIEFFSIVSMFSMWPLLKREGLGVAFVGLILIFVSVLGFPSLRVKGLRLLSGPVYTLFVVLVLAEFNIQPPMRYPDLFVVLNVVLSFCCFALSYLYLHLRMFNCPVDSVLQRLDSVLLTQKPDEKKVK
ncbi:hypothetical protein MIR68_012294 [Amoeboaphelidium protococcarum]|nr:hypothetical protein MIR68_012294 [Amoeboaphelidium protococcarum]